jgi:ethanolamine utilization protein EutN
VLYCEVTDQVWGPIHAEGLEGYRLLVVRPLRRAGTGANLDDAGLELPASGGELVAADRLGAGPGERVLVATGSRVRDLTFGPAAPFKSLVVAIVDSDDLGGGSP